MNVIRRPTVGLATEFFDKETLALLHAMEVELPEFAGLDLDVAFGTPLEMYAAGPLLHEQLDGLDIHAAIEAIEARENRMLAARDIAAGPVATELLRERLVDVVLPYAAQLALADTEVSASEDIGVNTPLAA
ncbi:hypothetical protein OG819_55390 [Streptomyces sp. NBC_01549]|uniref:hypothetical protein n=1 Tax=Streptomyces sp. NBC_01549 TaxID=2975874 RepID=UPI00225B8208|nr:hypothetical protein [Streptomyces sp. NBC_01549]MCX4598343.1 hypothetical protein [Streptomyces sp. NBC_01549]